MAGNTTNRKVTITAHTKGVTEATKKVKGLGKATTETARRQNEIKRAQEGVHKESLSTAKSFSKQQQGLGGLVRAYATIAANLFALTAAYGILRRAADFQSMMISADAMESRLGTSVSNIAKSMQRASGHAIDFRQALESTNRALAAGFNAAQVKELTDVVARASQTFGGSVEANMNKAIQAVLRGRTETLATMGIVIDGSRAYIEYAETIGKTAKDLSKFEQKQAIINALLKEGKKNLEGVPLDANPFQQLANTFFDTAQDILKVIVEISQPFIKLINLSKEFSLLLIGTLGAIFLKKLTPDIEGYSLAATKSFQRVQLAVERQKMAVLNLAKAQEEANAKAIAKDIQTKRASVQQWILLEGKKAQAAKTTNKTLSSLFVKMQTEGVAAFKNLSAATKRELGTLQANLTRYINDPTDKSVMKAIQGKSVQEARALRDAIDIAITEKRRMNRVVAQSTATANTWALSIRKASTELTLASANIRNAWSRQRLMTMTLIQNNGLLIGSYKALTLAKYSALRATVLYTNAGGRLPGVFKRIAMSAALASAAVGIFQALLQKLPLIIGSITTLMFAWQFIKEKLNLGKETEVTKKLAEAYSDLAESTSKASRRIADLQNLQRSTRSGGLAGISAEANFLANAASEVLDPIKEIRAQIAALGLNSAGKPVSDVLRDLTAAMREAKTEAREYSGTLGMLSKAFDEASLSSLNASIALRKRFKLPTAGLESQRADLMTQLGLTGREGEAEEARDLIIKQGQEVSKAIESSIAGVFQTANLMDVAFPEAQLGKKFAEEQLTGALNAMEGISPALKVQLRHALLSAIESQDPKEFGRAVSKILEESQDTIGINNYYIHSVEAFQQFMALVEANSSRLVTNLSAVGEAGKAFGEISADIAKLRQEKGDVFFDTAGVTQEVKLFRDFKNTIDDVAASGLYTNEVLQALTADPIFAALFNITDLSEGTEGLRQLSSQVEGYLDVYRRFAADKVLAPLKKEIIDIEKKILTTEIGRTTNLDEVFNKTKLIFEKDREILSNKIKSLEFEREAIRLNIQAMGVTSERGRILSLQYRVLEKQTEEVRQQLSLINSQLEAEVKVIQIQIERDNARIASINNIIGAETRLRNLLGDTTSIYAAQTAIFAKRQKVIDLQGGNIGRQVQEIELRIRDKDFKEEDLKKLIALEGQILALMVEQMVISREQARTSIRLAANDGSIEAKQQSFLLQLVEAGEELARSMEDSGMRAAQGIASAVTKSFDTAIDMLLEGTGDFIEAFKGILRETLGDFLKQNIQEATTALFATLAKDKLLSMGGQAAETVQDMTIAATTANTSALQALSIQVGNLITVMGAPSIDVTQPMSLAKEGEGQASSILNSIAGNTAMTTAATENVASTVVSEGFQQVVHTTELAALQAISLGVGQLVMGQMQTNFLLQTMGGSEALGGVVEGLGAAFAVGGAVPAANGAIFDGGLKRYATGGITNGPELALIGEGRNREAVIPMPNNKEVPVQLLGSGGNDVNITNVYDFRDANPSSETKLRAHSEKIKRDTFNNVFSEINKGGAYAKMVGRRK